jgi:hypothetical protein
MGGSGGAAGGGSGGRTGPTESGGSAGCGAVAAGGLGGGVTGSVCTSMRVGAGAAGLAVRPDGPEVHAESDSGTTMSHVPTLALFIAWLTLARDAAPAGS